MPDPLHLLPRYRLLYVYLRLVSKNGADTPSVRFDFTLSYSKSESS
jgi:hypothetical protein